MKTLEHRKAQQLEISKADAILRCYGVRMRACESLPGRVLTGYIKLRGA